MTPPPTRTLRELYGIWLKRASDTLNMAVSSREAQVADVAAIARCADELAATLNGMRCETCQHLAPFVVKGFTYAGECNHQELGGSEVRRDHFCAAHSPRTGE